MRRRIDLPVTDPASVVETIWGGVTPRTRVLFLSHITSPTALRLPVEELVRRGREAGLITVVDGAHVPGQLDLDLEALGADFYSGNCHKWLLAPKGAGFLHARPEMQPLLEPLIVSWGWESRDPGPSPFIDHFEWTGTRDPSAWLSVPAAIEFQRANDWETERRRCREMIRTARRRITAVTGLEPICPDDGTWFHQMHALPLPAGVDAPGLQRRLREEYRIEVPVPRPRRAVLPAPLGPGLQHPRRLRTAGRGPGPGCSDRPPGVAALADLILAWASTHGSDPRGRNDDHSARRG